MNITIPVIPLKFGRRQFIKMSLSLMAGTALSSTPLHLLETQAQTSGSSDCHPYGQGVYGQGVYCGIFSSSKATLALTLHEDSLTSHPTSFESDFGSFELSEDTPSILFDGIVQEGVYQIALANPELLAKAKVSLIGVTCETPQGEAVEGIVVNHDAYTAEIPLQIGQHLTCTFFIEPTIYSDKPLKKIYLPAVLNSQAKINSIQVQETNAMNEIRLPQINADQDVWGDYLNEFLRKAHYDKNELGQAGQVKNRLRVSDVQVDFGAMGDGTADDTTAIQTALDKGGLVYLPPGNYLVKETLIITQNHTTLFGAGSDSKIISVSKDYGIAVNHGVQFTTFRDFGIVGEASQLTLGNGLEKRLRAFLLNYDEKAKESVSKIHSKIHTIIERVTIKDWCTAISSQAASYLLVKDCLIQDMISSCEEGYGITSSTSKAYYVRNRFINTPGDRHGRHAIYINGTAEDVWVVDNYVYGYDRAPIVSRIVFRNEPTRSGKNYHYLHNKLVSSHETPHSNSGVISLRCVNYNTIDKTKAGRLENVVIEGNIIQKCGGRGISIDHARQVTLNNNIISEHRESSLIGMPQDDKCDGSGKVYKVYNKLYLEWCEDVTVGQMSIEIVEEFIGDATKIDSDQIMSGVYLKNCARVAINQIQFKAQESSAGLEIENSRQITVQTFMMSQAQRTHLTKIRALFIRNSQSVTIDTLSIWPNALPPDTDEDKLSLTNVALIGGKSDYITIKHIENLPDLSLTDGLYRIVTDAGHGKFLDLYNTGTLVLTDASTIQWDVAQGTQAEVTLSANEYVFENPTNLRDGAVYRLFIKQGANKTINWGDKFVFPNGTNPTLSSNTDLLIFTCLEETLYGLILPNLAE